MGMSSSGDYREDTIKQLRDVAEILRKLKLGTSEGAEQEMRRLRQKADELVADADRIAEKLRSGNL